MIEKECEIVTDLLPVYVKNEISDVTKEFVETHIEKCKDCKEKLEFLSRKRKCNSKTY